MVCSGLLGACVPESKNPEIMVKLDQLRQDTGLGINELNRAIRSEPKEAGLYKLRSRLALNKKDYPAALQDIIQAIKLNSANGECYFIQARILRAMGEPSKALVSARQALALHYVSSDLYMLIGEIHLTLQDEREALRYLNEALKLYPSNGYALFYKGKAYAASGDTLRAIGNLQAALREEPAFTASYTELAGLYNAKKSYRQAGKYLQQALLLEPSNGQLWYFSGLTYERMALPDSAILSYQKASAINPAFKQFTGYRQARIAFEKQDYASAIQSLLSLLEFDRNHDAARWMLAESYEKSGHLQQALGQYQVLREKNSNDRKANLSYWRLHQRLNMRRSDPIPLIEHISAFKKK